MRRFQFSLRTLLLVVTVLAIPAAYVGWQAKIVRERRAFLLNHAHLLPEDENPAIETRAAPVVLRFFGAESVYIIYVFGPADAARAASLFPEASIVDREGTEQQLPP